MSLTRSSALLASTPPRSESSCMMSWVFGIENEGIPGIKRRRWSLCLYLNFSYISNLDSPASSPSWSILAHLAFSFRRLSSVSSRQFAWAALMSKSYANIAYPSTISIEESLDLKPKQSSISGNATNGIAWLTIVYQIAVTSLLSIFYFISFNF